MQATDTTITSTSTSNETILTTLETIQTLENDLVQPGTSGTQHHRKRLRDYAELSDDDEEDCFNYMGSVGNMQVMEEVYARNRAERNQRELIIAQRILEITASDISKEVERNWRENKLTRKRVSAADKKTAFDQLKLNIRRQETENVFVNAMQDQ